MLKSTRLFSAITATQDAWVDARIARDQALEALRAADPDTEGFDALLDRLDQAQDKHADALYAKNRAVAALEEYRKEIAAEYRILFG